MVQDAVKNKMGDFRDLPLLPEAPSVRTYHVVSHNIWWVKKNVNHILHGCTYFFSAVQDLHGDRPRVAQSFHFHHLTSIVTSQFRSLRLELGLSVSPR